jgi:nitronate monooxygenase
MKLPQLTIRGRTATIPIVQGGMGVGISRSALAGAVAHAGGVGTLSSACLDFLISKDLGYTVNTHFATEHEISSAQNIARSCGIIGINIMRYLDRDYVDSVHGAITAGADMIVSGAGLPLSLPQIVAKADIALVPIVSSLRALTIICKRWEKFSRRPDAVVVEGPLAGGHLGFEYTLLTHEKNALEDLFPPIKDFARKNGDFPVIVAGGIHTHDDIVTWITRGADGVQLGTRFLTTHESGATKAYKKMVVKCTKNDIIIAHKKMNPPGSPSGMPFRTIQRAPMFKYGAQRKPLCNRGYLLQKDVSGHYVICGAKEDPRHNFCICNGLLASCGYVPSTKEAPLYTVGAYAHRIKKIISVHDLLHELIYKRS